MILTTGDRGVLAKLIAFSVSLAVVPITSYFVSEKYVWNGTPKILFTRL